jgi:hypothetical protein
VDRDPIIFAAAVPEVAVTSKRCSIFLQIEGSGYFCSMFGPHFKEGQELCSESPKDILMPEDDAATVEIICKILYFGFMSPQRPRT